MLYHPIYHLKYTVVNFCRKEPAWPKRENNSTMRRYLLRETRSQRKGIPLGLHMELNQTKLESKVWSAIGTKFNKLIIRGGESTL